MKYNILFYKGDRLVAEQILDIPGKAEHINKKKTYGIMAIVEENTAKIEFWVGKFHHEETINLRKGTGGAYWEVGKNRFEVLISPECED